MSKSLGNVVEPVFIAQRYGTDAVRYFLLREIPFGQDGNYSHDSIVARINGDLANGLGNLAKRSLSMVNKNLEGKVPHPAEFSPEDKKLLVGLQASCEDFYQAVENFALHKALDIVWQQVALGNVYISAQAPWTLKETDPVRMGTVLYCVMELVRRVAILVQPAMPQSCSDLLDLLAVPEENRMFANLEDMLVPGTSLPEPIIIFPRWVDPD